VTSTFVYDAKGQITTRTQVIAGKTYKTSMSYDANGQITQMTLPSGRVIWVMGRNSQGPDGQLSAPPEIVRPPINTAPDEGRLTAEYLALHALATCGDTKALKANSPTTITFLSQDDLKALTPQDFVAQGGVYY
jgi:YD repeat-containing protein